MAGATQIETMDDVDPEIRRFVDSLNAGYGQFENFSDLPLDQRRAAAEKIREPWRQGGPEMWATHELDHAGARLRVLRPLATVELPVLLYVHGGGWTMFSIDTHDRLMREYAVRAGMVVVGIDYSLSPEARFPTALDQVVAAAGWLREHGAEFGIDGSRIAIGGDSAGGNLAVAAALRLREVGAVQPAALLLNYGAFDPAPSASYERFGGARYMLTPQEMELFWCNYTRSEADRSNPLFAPILADLHGLPPCFITIAECDILADCNKAMAARLTEHGVTVTARTYLGATHSFLEAVSISALARRAIDEAGDWLAAQLGLLKS